MDATTTERAILDAVTEELAADTEFGKRVADVRLEGDYPHSRITVEVVEMRPPLELWWSRSYELWDGSWDQGGSETPQPGSVAALLSTDLMESTGAFFDCVTGGSLDDNQRTVARLAVKNFDDCLRFYRDGLNFASAIRSVEVNPPKATLQLGNALLTLVPWLDDKQVGEPPRRLYCSLMYLRVSDIDQAIGPLAAWDPQFRKREMLDGLYARLVHVADPDGNLVELTDNAPLAPV